MMMFFMMFLLFQMTFSYSSFSTDEKSPALDQTDLYNRIVYLTNNKDPQQFIDQVSGVLYVVIYFFYYIQTNEDHLNQPQMQKKWMWKRRPRYVNNYADAVFRGLG